MTATSTSFGAAGPSPSNASLGGLDGVNFFIAGISAAFGPYVAAYLADQKWTQQNIGFVLTASGLAGLLTQLPGGSRLDTIRSKRARLVVGVTGVAPGAPHHHTSGQPARASRRSLWKSSGLLTCATCLFLFQLANASILPLVAEAVVYQEERRSSLIISAMIILPQIIVALMAPWVG